MGRIHLNTTAHAALIAIFFGRACLASEGPPPVLNPRTYVSPSGEFELYVDPTTMYGQGEGTYRLTRKGQQVWAGQQPFTLWEAGVTDQGVIAGYAYTHGWRGFPAEADRGRLDESKHYGQLHVAIFEPDGKLRLNHRVRREPSRFLHTPPNPLVDGMFIDEDNDRLVLRVSDADVNRDIGTWWVFRLSTGTRLADLQPKTKIAHADRRWGEWDARPVRGTPLTLVHWSIWGPSAGAAFTLIDLDGRPVWTHELPGDYAAKGDHLAQSRLMFAVRERGAILRCDQPRHFDLWHVAESKRVSFEVRNTPHHVVAEIGQQDYTPRTPPGKPAEIESIELEKVGMTVFGGTRERPADDRPCKIVRAGAQIPVWHIRGSARRVSGR